MAGLLEYQLWLPVGKAQCALSRCQSLDAVQDADHHDGPSNVVRYFNRAP